MHGKISPLCGLDFRDIKFYIASRNTVENLIKKGIITGQGKKKDGVATGILVFTQRFQKIIIYHFMIIL